MLKIILTAVIAYCIGNISPAILIGKVHGVDIRKEGSGNAGTTNVIRVLGVKSGLLTLLIDVLKGFVAVEIGSLLCDEYGMMLAFAFVVLGHCFPAFYNFKGGKGVATTLGCALALNWQTALIAFGVAVVMLLVSRRMSVGSLTAVVAYPILIHFFVPQYTLFAVLMALFIAIMHTPNIKRLIKGEEKKLTFGKKKNEDI